MRAFYLFHVMTDTHSRFKLDRYEAEHVHGVDV